MKLFKNINFKTHPYTNGVIGTLDLGDGLVLSVVQGEGLYGNVRDHAFEIALFNGDDYVPLNAYEDVMGWQTPDQIDVILTEIQKDSQEFISKRNEEKEKYKESKEDG